MKKNPGKVFSMLLFITTFYIAISAEVTRFGHNPNYSNPWGCDTILIGAEVTVADSTKDVYIRWKKPYSQLVGELVLMDPFIEDSARFIFHNLPERFSGEDTLINLGKFPVETPLVFRYTVVDTNAGAQIRGKKLFSGQNRDSIDPYISERKSLQYGHRWAGVCEISTDKVIVGFSESYPVGFFSVLFEVDGVNIRQ